MAGAEMSLQQADLRTAEGLFREAVFQGWLLVGALESVERRAPEARHAIADAALFATGDRDGGHALAAAHLRLGEPARAVEILEGLAAQDPRDGETRRLLGRALAAAGQRERAEAALAEAARLASTDPELAFHVAADFLWLKKPAQAEPLFARVLAARPIPQTRVLVARAYRDSGEYDRARAALEAALAQDPRVRRAHYYLGMVALADPRTGPERLEKAMQEFRAELALAPGDPAASDQLGLALLESERAADALPALEAAVRGEERSLHYLHLGRALLALGRTAESAAASRRALELALEHGGRESDIGRIHYQLGLALRRMGATQEATQHLAEAQRRAGADPANDSGDPGPLAEIPLAQRQALKRRARAAVARAFFNLGVIQVQDTRPMEAKERFARAAAFFERAAAIDPDFPQLSSSLGVAYFNARMFEEATVPLERAVAASPEDAGLKRLLATSWINTAAWDKAAALLADDPGRAADASLQFAYGLALLRGGRAAEAAPILEALLAADPQSAELDALVREAHALQAGR
jgi:tetratricopeptide (TPR) repeat protein